ncbi:MAG: conjugal transfer protein TraC [Sphingobacteriaceae bacterium]|nr:MAG: conjugal transfer protein TraC [Sphingobacteriaceae bacterium]
MLSNLFQNIGRICGLSNPAELGYQSSEVVRDYIKKSTLGAIPLANYLSYRYFDKDSNLFFNEGDITGFMIEISPIVGSNSDLEKNLNLFFNSELPSDSHIQFLLIASHNIEDKLSLWKRKRNRYSTELLSKLTAYREAFLKEKAQDFESTDGRMGRDFKIYICFSKKNGASKNTELIKSFQRKLLQKLKTLKLSPRVCIARDLMFVAGDIAQMQLKDRGYRKYDPINSLSEQILKPQNRMIIDSCCIYHMDEELVSKCFYPLVLPQYFSLTEMINLLGSEQEGMSIPARFLISYSLATDIDKVGAKSITNQGLRVLHAAEKSYTRNDINIKYEAAEWKEIIAKNNNGERFLTECMQVMITSTKQEIEIAEETIKSLYNTVDWQLELNKNIQLPAMLSMLPMQQCEYWPTLKTFQLVKKVQSKEVVAKMPIHGEWKGVPDSGVLFLGRRGEMFNWTPFYRVGGAGNFNICVMAPAGGGKSVLLQELAISMLVQEKSVFILDIGASYQNICDLVEGESVRFNKEGNISLNPFASIAGSGASYITARDMLAKNYSYEEVCYETGLSTEQIDSYIDSLNSDGSNDQDEKIEILKIGKHYVTKDSIIYAKSIIAAMCGIKGDAHKEAVLELAINQGVETYGTNLDITRLAEVLSQLVDVDVSKELAQTLYPYTEKGIHGRFFKAGPTASFKKMMTVFEFEEVKNDEVLLGVILQVILMQVTMQFLCGDRSRKFLLIVDEAWMILDFCANFLEAFARTVRKYGGSLVTCVQDLASFNAGRSQKAILENSSWKAVLKQTNMESFRESDAFKNSIGLVESITKETNNKYSEVLLQTSGLVIVGRLVLDPYSVALYSTEQEDFHFLSQCKAKGMSKDEAVTELSKKYGQLPIIEN